MTNTHPIPVALSAVSYVFLALAILAVIGILGSAMSGSFHLDFNIVGFWICFGLRRYSSGWRTCALVFIWVLMICMALAFLYGLFGYGQAFIKIFGKRYADIPAFWVSIVSAVFLHLSFGCIEFSQDRTFGECLMMSHRHQRPDQSTEPPAVLSGRSLRAEADVAAVSRPVGIPVASRRWLGFIR
jgi:hypothetical protein